MRQRREPSTSGNPLFSGGSYALIASSGIYYYSLEKAQSKE